jgi:hypothetical protein
MSDDNDILVLKFKMIPPGGTIPPDLILFEGDTLQVKIGYNAAADDGWRESMLDVTSVFEAREMVRIVFDHCEVVSGDPQKIAQIYYNERRL